MELIVGKLYKLHCHYINDDKSIYNKSIIMLVEVNKKARFYKCLYNGKIVYFSMSKWSLGHPKTNNVFECIRA